jgi:hypothetical protein
MTHIEISEPYPVLDVFCMELARIDQLGPCTRLTFCVWERSTAGDNKVDHVVTARVVVPSDALVKITQQLLQSGKAPTIDDDKRLVWHAQH